MQYIVDYYNDLPRWMVFVHGHNTSEHQPDKVSVLRVRYPCLDATDLADSSASWLPVPESMDPFMSILHLGFAGLLDKLAQTGEAVATAASKPLLPPKTHESWLT